MSKCQINDLSLYSGLTSISKEGGKLVWIVLVKPIIKIGSKNSRVSKIVSKISSGFIFFLCSI